MTLNVRSELHRNLRWGIKWGVALSVIISVFAAIPALVRALAPGEYAGRDVSYPVLVALYLFSGLIGGSIVGALRPLTAWWLGRRLLGMLVGFPIMFATAYTIVGVNPFAPEHATAWVFTSVVWGFAMGFAFEENLIPRRLLGGRRRR